MGRSSKPPVLAAGGIVVRNDPKPRVAIVQRRRDKAWVLPKGKLKRNEKPIAAARREVREETGCDVCVHEFLGVMSHPGGGGSKITHFWRMQVIDHSVRKLTRDIRAVEWLPLPAAIDRLSLPHEQSFLREIGPHALRRSVETAPLREAAPAITQPSVNQVAPEVVPDAAAVRSRSKSGWNVLAGLIRRLLGRQEGAA